MHLPPRCWIICSGSAPPIETHDSMARTTEPEMIDFQQGHAYAWPSNKPTRQLIEPMWPASDHHCAAKETLYASA
jgi:hypothetical protein